MSDGFIPWQIHPDRANQRLTDLDIKTALAYFVERTGKEATAIVLHPSVEKRLPAIPDGVEVVFAKQNLSCPLAHEVFLPVPVDLPKPPDKPPNVKEVLLHQESKGVVPPVPSTELCNIPKKDDYSMFFPVSKRGRPLKRGEVHRTTEWRRRKKQKQVVLL